VHVPTSREDPLTPLWNGERAISKLLCKGRGHWANRQADATSVIGTRRLAHLALSNRDPFWRPVKQDDEYSRCSGGRDWLEGHSGCCTSWDIGESTAV
jgi:hypothetical protein